MMLLDHTILVQITTIQVKMIVNSINNIMKNLLRKEDKMVPSISNIHIEVIILKNYIRLRKFLIIFKRTDGRNVKISIRIYEFV